MAKELSHQETRELLEGYFNKDREDKTYIWIKDIWEGQVVYEEDGQTLRASYMINDDGIVTVEEPEQVKVEYVKFAELKDVEVLKMGTFTAANGMSVTFTEADLDKVLQNFNDMPTNKIPLAVGHAEGQASELINALTAGAPAIGYMENLKKVVNAGVPVLVAGFGEIAEKAVDKIGSTLVRISPELFTDFKDNDGESHGLAFKRISFVDRSSIRELADVTQANLAFSEGQGQESLVLLLHEDETGKTKTGGDTDMSVELLAKLQKDYEALMLKFSDQGDQLAAALKLSEDAKTAEAGAVAKLSEAASKAHTDGIAEFLAPLKEAGKVSPAMEPTLVAFMEALPHGADASIIKFGEAGKEQSLDPLGMFKEMVSKLPDLVTFGELAPGGESDTKTLTSMEADVMGKLGLTAEDVEKFGEGGTKEIIK